MIRIAGFSSDTGDILMRMHDQTIPDATVSVVITDRESPALTAAADREIPTERVDGGTDLRALLSEYSVDLVCLDGYEPALSAAFLESAPPTLDAYSSLLPAFADGDPVAGALDAGVRVTGVTVHVVTPDDRPIVTQEPVPVYADDTIETLRTRLEHEGCYRAYPRAVEWIAADQVSFGPGVMITGDEGGDFPARRFFSSDRSRALRYGENPHQDAALYRDRGASGAGVVDAVQCNESAKALSYNNYNDTDAAWGLINEFDRPAAAVIKHTNPAGCAVADTIADAYDRALRTDPMSAFGGIVALNRECDTTTAEHITESFKEVVIAPGYTESALATLRSEDNLRVLDAGRVEGQIDRFTEKPLVGGRLVQERDRQRLTPGDLDVVTGRTPTTEQVETMVFAWQTIKHVKSNAIVFATGTETVGIGMGQVSRVDAVRLAAMKADEHAEGKTAEAGVMASDAFFPFPDGVERAAEAGIEAVVQPGGSVNDEQVIEAANDHDMAMAFTGRRCFRHD